MRLCNNFFHLLRIFGQLFLVEIYGTWWIIGKEYLLEKDYGYVKENEPEIEKKGILFPR